MIRLAQLRRFTNAGASHVWQTACWFAKSLPAACKRSFTELAFPPICAGCEQDIEHRHDVLLCSTCRRTFEPPSGTICPRCAAPAPAASIRPTGCLHCHDDAFRFHQIAALGVYRGDMQKFVLRMKHQDGEALALAAGRLLARRIQEQRWSRLAEIVTAVPMHWSRRLRRDANSAAVLAEAVASELRLPLALDLVRAVRMVPRQAGLTPSRRRHNMRKVFAVSSAYDVRGAHLLVIDDVLTTGATANAISQALRLANSETISFGVVARGIGAT